MVHITYFVHGTTPDNEQKVSSGWKDVELSQLGKEQVAALKVQIQHKQFDVIFCSDLHRAVQTADILFDNVDVIQDPRLRECNYGIYNGKSSTLVEPMQETMIYDSFPEGESCEQVKGRIEDFVKYLREHYQGKHVAIVAHKFPQLALDVLLKKKSWEQAFAEDWRKTKAWRPGWEYVLEA